MVDLAISSNDVHSFGFIDSGCSLCRMASTCHRAKFLPSNFLILTLDVEAMFCSWVWDFWSCLFPFSFFSWFSVAAAQLLRLWYHLADVTLCRSVCVWILSSCTEEDNVSTRTEIWQNRDLHSSELQWRASGLFLLQRLQRSLHTLSSSFSSSRYSVRYSLIY